VIKGCSVRFKFPSGEIARHLSGKMKRQYEPMQFGGIEADDPGIELADDRLSIQASPTVRADNASPSA
jgi:hypothetical protein